MYVTPDAKDLIRKLLKVSTCKSINIFIKINDIYDLENFLFRDRYFVHFMKYNLFYIFIKI